MFVFTLKKGKNAETLLFYFFQKKIKGFLGPSQPPQNPKKSNFLNFYHNQSSIPFHIVQMSNVPWVSSLIFFYDFKNLLPEMGLFWVFFGMALSQKGLDIFQSPFAHGVGICCLCIFLFLAFSLKWCFRAEMVRFVGFLKGCQKVGQLGAIFWREMAPLGPSLFRDKRWPQIWIFQNCFCFFPRCHGLVAIQKWASDLTFSTNLLKFVIFPGIDKFYNLQLYRICPD